uniref:Uncharacterized protein n=1 Tax=Nelumbo nucifera TaxID=4432 RepID=A0A822XXC6_NELNU|nr:TPA_asm: hypothetical protein HUJ06_025827 [Nelumbo nucifera]
MLFAKVPFRRYPTNVIVPNIMRQLMADLRQLSTSQHNEDGLAQLKVVNSTTPLEGLKGVEEVPNRNPDDVADLGNEGVNKQAMGVNEDTHVGVLHNLEAIGPMGGVEEAWANERSHLLRLNKMLLRRN